ncbi:MAG TPA: adenylosuccinate synthetase, partial [Thermoleophilaceae bacterium]|nr:adenylosuccinate synthetase [Thermoleophilaceae bacterium]
VATRYLGSEDASFDEFPYHQSIVHKARGELTELPGWDEDITGAHTLEDLPENARRYLEFVSDHVGVPLAFVGVGPGRDQIIATEVAQRTVGAAG